MDQHPIPQDVTGFQFKLIGTMTVKQFGYVACGVIAAVVLYYLPLNSALGVLLKVFLIPLMAAGGVIIAFVPIDGRPIDVMTTNFVKAVFSPNQYIYQRQGRKLSFETVYIPKVQAQNKTQQQKTANPQQVMTNNQSNQKEEKLRLLLMNSHPTATNAIDKKEAAFLKTLTIPTATTIPQQLHTAASNAAPQIITPSPIAKPTHSPAPMIQPVIPTVQNQQLSPPPQKKEAELAQKETVLQQELTQAKQEELTSADPALHTVAEQKVSTLTKQLEEVHSQKQLLEKELSQLQEQLATQKSAPVSVTTAATPSVQKTPPTQLPEAPHVRVIPQDVTKKAGLPHVSDSPNVVVGIVKDPRGNILPNILVEVKDKDGNPVRAFKTNQLGQFASATPLSPGAYSIELEDPKQQQQFDVIQLTANNQILPPIEVISHDAREELRQQLFA
jgi:PrgI family protein